MRPLTRFALLATLCAAVLPAWALPFHFTGSFTGTVTEADPLPLGSPPPRPQSYYEGATATGTFDVYVPDPTVHDLEGDDDHYFLNGGGHFAMSFQIRDDRFDIFQGTPPEPWNFPSIIDLAAGSASAGQSVRFMTDFRPRYSGGIMTVHGPSGSLFDQLDARTLHLTPGAALDFDFYFASSLAHYAFQVEPTSVRYGLAPAVPEPAAVLMVAVGVALVARARARRRGAPCAG